MGHGVRWLVAVLLCGLAAVGAAQAGVPVAAVAQLPEGAIRAQILRWDDGDTAQVRLIGEAPSWVGRLEVVRVLGINAPEVGEPLSEEARRYFRNLTMGKPVYVELSPWERRDTHSRLLAHLWVETTDGLVLVGEAIVRAGLARLLVYYPEREKHYCRLLRALTLAQRDKVGLWAKFPEPVSLGQVEADPVRYVTEAVTVLFRVGGVGWDRERLSLWAAASRYGFRVMFDPKLCPASWAEADLPTEALVGRTIAVSGELLWDSFGGGPRIVVHFPEQLVVKEDGR